jgi:hypothetical protein
MTKQKSQSDKSEIKFLEALPSRFAELKFIVIIL